VTVAPTVMVSNARASRWRRSRRPPVFAIVVLTLFVLTAIFGPLLSPASPTATDLESTLLPPFWVHGGSTAHLLGTDQLGRDVLSRVVYGARSVLVVSALSVGLAGGVGSTIGIIAAYRGGVVDLILMRFVDIMLAFPAMIIALLLAVQLGPGFINVVIVISLILWTTYARQVRGDALIIMKKDYVALARTAGRSGLGIMVRHVLPNTVTTIITLATLQIGVAIILEASLSFLGVGIPPPAPSWGGMVADGEVLVQVGWWLSVFPGLAIVLVVLASNILGDWIASTLNPRDRG
jgi:peptide/nickel transport system permease protein